MIPPRSRFPARPPKAKATPALQGSDEKPLSGGRVARRPPQPRFRPGSRGLTGPGPGIRRRAQLLSLRGRTLWVQSASPGVTAPDSLSEPTAQNARFTCSHRRAGARASSRGGRSTHRPVQPESAGKAPRRALRFRDVIGQATCQSTGVRISFLAGSWEGGSTSG